jgi:hypothetical protein
VLRDAKLDLDMALDLGPASGELLYHSSGLYATASREDATHIETAFKYLTMAVDDHGYNPKDLGKDPMFAPLKDDARFQALTGKTPIERPTRWAKRFVDPIKDSVP